MSDLPTDDEVISLIERIKNAVPKGTSPFAILDVFAVLAAEVISRGPPPAMRGAVRDRFIDNIDLHMKAIEKAGMARK